MSKFYLVGVYFSFFSLYFFSMGLNLFKENLFMVIEWEMISLNSVKLIFPLILDYKGSMFLATVFLISSMVIFYSNSYMNSDLNCFRFLLLLILFILSMLFLILSPCLISIILGWDGLGLTSYCLVIFYQNQKSSNSGMITALTNRIGDVLILLSIGLMSSLGSWNFSFMYFFDSGLCEFITVLVGFAAMTKSAQIPFSAWLPAAMAAPTPVSSLVHSSTLVTAGVYLLIRFSCFLVENQKMMFFLSLVGSSTMVMSGLSANKQFDMKKIIALSTLSQLGVMFTSLSLSMIDLCFFHLLTHAMFKSLLFMCAGLFIHYNLNNQDIRFFGNSINFFPISLIFFNTANLSLCGMPFLSGFYSKDLILELISLNSVNLLIFFMFFFGTGLTVCYSTRLIYKSVNMKFNYVSSVINLGDLSKDMIFSMSIMFFCSIFMGKLGSQMFLSTPFNFIVLPLSLKFLTLIFCSLGFFSGLLISFDQKIKLFSFSNYNSWLNLMWFLTIISPSIFKSSVLLKSNSLCLTSTSGWIEEVIGESLINSTQKSCTSFLSWVSKSNFLLSFFSLNFSFYLLMWF